MKCVPTISLAKRYIGMRDRHFFCRIHQGKRKEKKDATFQTYSRFMENSKDLEILPCSVCAKSDSEDQERKCAP